MKATRKIDLPPAMKTAAARKIFEALGKDETGRVVLFVGGCVRDALLGPAICEPAGDIDLATVLPPDAVIEKLRAVQVKVVPTGFLHGTVTAILDGQEFQITTLRRDVETDGRRAVVSFTGDWAEDALRRDFTLNTLLMDIKGRVFDPLGVGMGDLERRRIVFVGDAADRIREDYLRILRYFRFQSAYGRGKIDPVALEACKHLASGLKTLSKERVTAEFSKIVTSRQAGKILRTMRDNNILKPIIDVKFDETHFNYLKRIGKNKNVVLGLLAAAGFSISGTRRIEKELRLSKKQAKQIVEIVSYLKKFIRPDDFTLRLLLYRAGPETAALVLAARLAIDAYPLVQARRWLDLLAGMERPVLPVGGDDFIAQGIEPGPAIKKALEKAERLWIAKKFKS